MLKKRCFATNNYFQLEELIQYKTNKRKILIIYIRNYLIVGFGIDWLKMFIKMVKKKYSKQNIKFFVDAGNDHGLSILLLRENIDYLKLRSNKIIFKKINQLAKKNKVLLNPNFHVVDISRSLRKNYEN